MKKKNTKNSKGQDGNFTGVKNTGGEVRVGCYGFIYVFRGKGKNGIRCDKKGVGRVF